MRKALALAERGRGATSPNPMVGALVVDADGIIVGRGAHRVAGGPHAEVLALEDAGPLARGATLYCTLEPCSHTGRTGPCAPLVAASGIRRAVIAIEDPNPLVHGAGLAHLRSRGLDVTVGVEADRGRDQNRVFLTVMAHGRSYVIVKAALSLDGKVAAGPGERTPLTGSEANRRVQRQRAEVDAIGVGGGTLLADNPVLTARGAYRERPLTRVIFDRRMRTPPDARVFSTLDAGPVIIMSAPVERDRAAGRAAALEAAGARILVPAGDDFASALRALAQAGVSSLVLEGGPAVHRAAWSAGVVDEVELYLTPHLLGDRGVAWVEPRRLAWEDLDLRGATWLGADVLVRGYVHRTG
jgi:diaminohydroxyphosphoribosylaminopyrimidine deaminase/5-amino-6-(5-phosphoribosylamino)uracil reductase